MADAHGRREVTFDSVRGHSTYCEDSPYLYACGIGNRLQDYLCKLYGLIELQKGLMNDRERQAAG